jgi:hypothetical protein
VGGGDFADRQFQVVDPKSEHIGLAEEFLARLGIPGFGLGNGISRRPENVLHRYWPS